MQVGEVRVAMDSDFDLLKRLCEHHDEWDPKVNKNGIKVWTKTTDVTSFKMIKIHTIFKDIPAETVYDVVHDPEYRKKWDQHMLEGYELCCLNPNNDIGYYSLKCPGPLRNRDFVTQRSWLATDKEYMVFNHSVNHEKIPVKKGFIRGVSYLTGYLLRPSGKNGCELYYVTQSDPKGKLPSWGVNKLTTIMAPKITDRLYKAAKNYDAWKSKHNPQHKPWIYPEQMTIPRLNPSEIKPFEDISPSQSDESLDESDFKEEDFKEDDL